jgi:hypothetical protein
MEVVMDEEFTLVELGDAKEETRYGAFFPPTDGVNEFRF